MNRDLKIKINLLIAMHFFTKFPENELANLKQNKLSYNDYRTEVTRGGLEKAREHKR